MMQYLLMAHSAENAWATMTPDQHQQGMAAYMAYNEALKAADVLKSADRLAPTSAPQRILHVSNNLALILKFIVDCSQVDRSKMF